MSPQFVSGFIGRVMPPSRTRHHTPISPSKFVGIGIGKTSSTTYAVRPVIEPSIVGISADGGMMLLCNSYVFDPYTYLSRS